ncbi:MAG: response regulator [Bdellovibrionota bacterium]|nr:response regulator [Bdellovibrionota bacterium]
MMKILVIEDDMAMITLYRQWLKNTNVEIDYCDNSYKASEMIMKGSIDYYDLLIADLKLEGSKGGDSVVSLLAEMELGKKKKTPVLILSGHIDSEVKNQFLKRKNVHFLEKQFLNSNTFRNGILDIIGSS